MDTFVRDLRYALRARARMRGPALVALFTLAIGVAYLPARRGGRVDPIVVLRES